MRSRRREGRSREVPRTISRRRGNQLTLHRSRKSKTSEARTIDWAAELQPISSCVGLNSNIVSTWRDGARKRKNMAKITIHLKGYLPLSQNALKGKHWSMLHREKRRAALALHRALRSDLSCTVAGPLIGTTWQSESNPRKTFLSRLELYLMTTGKFFKGRSSPRNAIVPKTKA